MTDRSLDAVVFDLEKLQAEYLAYTEEETAIQDEITALREKFTAIRNKRVGLRHTRDKLIKERDSAERKIQLQQEQEAIEQEFQLLRDEAEKLIADAPWRQIAFDWQVKGALKLAAASRGLLADKRGMGKTLTSLIWRRMVKAKKTLVLTRKSYAEEFIKEIHYREPGISLVTLVGPSPDQRKVMTDILKDQNNFVMVANHEMWRRATDAAVADLLKVGFDTVIFDEAHKLKNFKSVTTQGFLKIAAGAKNLLHMTGTPIKNRPQELFAILHTLYPDLFPDEKKYVYDYCNQVGQNRWVFRPGGLETLMNRMSKFFVARTPNEVGHKVPPPHITEYSLDFTGYTQQAEAYKVMTERSLALLNSGKALPIISQLAVMTRQAQMVSWPAGIVFTVEDPFTGIVERIQFDVHQSVKLDWAEDLIKELVEEGERIVLFSRFKPAIYELKRRLTENGVSVAVITGDEDHSKFREIGFDFDLKTASEKPKYDVLLGTYETISEALNLNAARHAILFDRYWNPGSDEQAIGRIDRLNSVDRANVHMPCVTNTIDVYMAELIEEKRDVLNNFKSAADMQERLKANLEASLQ